MKKILSIAVASTFAAITLTQGANAAPKLEDVFSSFSGNNSCSTEQCVLHNNIVSNALGENCKLSEGILKILSASGKLPSCIDIDKLSSIFGNCSGGDCILDFIGGSCQNPSLPENDGNGGTENVPEEESPSIPEDDTNTETPEKPEFPEIPEIEFPDFDAPDVNVPENDGSNDEDTNGGTENSPSYGTEHSEYVSEVVRLVNEHRAANGLSALSASNSSLMKAAAKRAQEQAQLFSHTRPNGQSWSTVLGEFGISYRGAGENVAYGQSSPAEVVNAWMNSEGHRANILNANFSNIGVGVHYQNGTYYWAQLFTN